MSAISDSSMRTFLLTHGNLLSTNCKLTDPHGHTFKEQDMVITVDENNAEFFQCPVTGESLSTSSILVIKSYPEEKNIDSKILRAVSIEVPRKVKEVVTGEIESATKQLREENKKLMQFFLRNCEQFTMVKNQLETEIKDLKANVQTLEEECDKSQKVIESQKEIISQKEGVIADKDQHIRYSKLSTGLLSGFGGATISAVVMTVFFTFKKK